jgi:hypothetical protein
MKGMYCVVMEGEQEDTRAGRWTHTLAKMTAKMEADRCCHSEVNSNISWQSLENSETDRDYDYF